MTKEYSVVTPADFTLIVKDVVVWAAAQNRENILIALRGELGAGKTTFTQELGWFLGVSEPITSPTFTIMKQYTLSNERFDTLVHIDAYRIEDESEIGPLHLVDIFRQPKTIVCVEWPEQIPSVLPVDVVLVDIQITKDEARSVTVQFPSEK